MFTLPKGDLGECQAMEGSINENPIVLEGHKAADFNALLRVLYPTSRDLLQGGPALDKGQWIGVLGLSTIWEMQEIRELAISKLSDQHPPLSLTAVEKVTLGRTHRVATWLISGLLDLTWADRVLSPEALGEAVGLRIALRIYSARLRRLSQHSRIVPVEVLSKQHPIVKSEVASCNTCSREFSAKAVGSIFTSAPPRLHFGPEIHSIFFLVPVSDFRCTVCQGQFFAQDPLCGSCGKQMASPNLCVFLGAQSSTVPSAEDLIREVFQEEIGECEDRAL